MIIKTAGSLFTGIGGTDLANEWMGWRNLFQCENNIPARKVLMKNFGSIPEGSIPFEYSGEKHRPVLYSDIKNFNGKEWYGKVDIISGGFPCQPFSVAGKRQGKADDRWLWHEMRRVIDEARPPWVVAENVAGIIKMDLDEVLSDLEAIGYSTETVVIPAASVNAPHKRDRVWIIAYSHSEAQSRKSQHGSEGFGVSSDTYSSNGQPLCGQKTTSGQQRAEINGVIDYNSGNRIIADSDTIRSLSARRIGELGGERLGIKDSQNDATDSGYGAKNKKVQPRWDAFTGEVTRTYRNDFENFPT